MKIQTFLGVVESMEYVKKNAINPFVFLTHNGVDKNTFFIQCFNSTMPAIYQYLYNINALSLTSSWYSLWYDKCDWLLYEAFISTYKL